MGLIQSITAILGRYFQEINWFSTLRDKSALCNSSARLLYVFANDRTVTASSVFLKKQDRQDKLIF